jgi:Flp pilus assembly protein TadD
MQASDFETGFAAPIRDALSRGAGAEALTAALDATAAHPDDAQALRLLAAAQRAAGDPAQALRSIDRAIALAPDDADAHFERAGLLLGARQLDDAQAALARSIGLDPNLFGAYLLQAQLALGRGDLDEADRLRRLAARVAPDHPHLAAIEGMLALRRGDAAGAQAVLAAALQRTPDDAQLGYALGFTYMQLGHLAFAEQVFRNVLAQNPDAGSLRSLIADLLRQQGRPDEAVAELAPLLADPEHATPGLRAIAGELELAAGHPERALPWLREALGAQPNNRRTLMALMEAWHQLGAGDDARATLDTALATSSELTDLWHARLSCEPVGDDSAHAVVARWLAAMPESVEALEAHMALQDMAGDGAGMDAAAQRIVAIQPGRSSGELRLLTGLLERDPVAAIARLDDLIRQTSSDDNRQLLRSWLGLAQDRAGRTTDAVATWSALEAEAAPNRLPLPDIGTPRTTWPALAPQQEDASAIALLWGAPGSGVERIAGLLDGVVEPFRADRFSAHPPHDLLQNYRTTAALLDGTQDPAEVIADWRALLPQRGIADGRVIDWLPWWDNALLLALRPQLPDALLLIALRDPRDMLLDWLAFGAALPPLAMASPLVAATWLAQVLSQIVTLHEENLYPHRLLQLDAAFNDPQALANLISAAIETPLPAPAAGSLGPPRFPAGHWRVYNEALTAPFAALTPVARRLGYE